MQRFTRNISSLSFTDSQPIISSLTLVFIVVIGLGYRINTDFKLKRLGGDFSTHRQAVEDFVSGVNPYIKTVASFKNLTSDPNDKGYAYFPGILYINIGLWSFCSYLNIVLPNGFSHASVVLHLPTYIAHLAIVLFFIKTWFKKSPLITVLSIAFWLFNPLFIKTRDTEGFDPVPIAFLLWSLNYLGKDLVISGTFLALGFVFKTFPMILIPVYLIYLWQNYKDRFFMSLLTIGVTGMLVLIAVSLPFMRSFYDFTTYITGALLVHGDRFVQGRPFLYYISYYYKIEFFRTIAFKTYSLLAMFSGWILIPLFGLLNIKKFAALISDRFSEMSVYALASVPFLGFYLFTPVLNRTYLLWGMPLFLIALGEFYLSQKGWRKIAYFLLLGFYWGFLYWYLIQWKDGFHIWFPV